MNDYLSELISLEHIESQEFFNFYGKYLSESIWTVLKQAHQSGDARIVFTEKDHFSYYTVPVAHTYRDSEFYSVKLNDGVDYDQLTEIARDKALPHSMRQAFLEAGEDNPFLIVSGRENHVADIACSIDTFDTAVANDIRHTLSKFIIERTEEGQTVAPVILAHQQAMYHYLKENNLAIDVAEIDFNLRDEHEVKAWFQVMQDEQNEQKSSLDDFPAYNDLDYKPFLLNGHYLIMDYSSDTFFIYSPKKQDDSRNGAWYSIAREEVWEEIKKLDKDLWSEIDQDTLSEIYYTSHQLEQHAINFAQNAQHLIARFEDGNLVEAGEGLETLNLYQSFIVSELQSQGIIADDKTLGIHIAEKPEQPWERVYVDNDDDDDIIILYREDTTDNHPKP